MKKEMKTQKEKLRRNQISARAREQLRYWAGPIQQIPAMFCQGLK